MKAIAFAALAILLSAVSSAQLAPNAPEDKPQLHADEQLAAVEKAIAPHVAKARETYPAAKAKYLAGLPRGETFFVTTRLYDTDGRMEQVFVQVTKIDGTEISGKIASQLRLVTGYQPGQEHTFPESDLIDWLIAKPDGSEEGNVVGKFLDTYRP